MPMYDFTKFDPFFVGAERIMKQFADIDQLLAKNIPNYPPYNIKKVEDNKYVIEMAVAGFGKSDLEILLDDGKLTVSGHVSGDSNNVELLHKGISSRPFSRQFTLADSVVVKDADLLNGMLRVFLENIIPESKKPKKVDIKDSSAQDIASDKLLLTE